MTPPSHHVVIGLGVVFLGCALAVLAGPAASQSIDWDPRAAEVSRAELTDLLGRLEAAATAPGYSQRLQDQARGEAEHIRARLEQGDFQVGDRIVLLVTGEPALSDTFTVGTGATVDLPVIGTVSLAAVLRSELQEHLRDHLARYLRDPDIRATALVRLAIMGAVARQGFYTLPATLLLEDAIMRAGGPVGRADMNQLMVERGERVVWADQALQTALIEGRTLDQMNLRAGDRIVLPERRAGLFEGGIVRTLLVTVPPLLYMIFRFAG